MQFEPPRSQRIDARLNFTPMVDIVFLLNIFFMLTARLTAVGSSVPVELPEASQAQAGRVHPPERVVINVLADGRVTYGDDPVTLPILRERLFATPRGATPVLIRADQGATLALVKRVVQACVKAGATELAFAARPTPPQEERP